MRHEPSVPSPGRISAAPGCVQPSLAPVEPGCQVQVGGLQQTRLLSGAQPEGKPEVLERSASVDGASWRIGVVDSGFSSTQQDRVEAARAFVLDEAGQVRQEPVGPDCLCHGSAMLAVMAEAVPEARFCVAQVFGRTGSTSSAQIAMAIDWLRDCGVRLINLSLGVRQDYPGLAQACARARAAGVILVAASPPRGEPVFPAAYPGVLAATGDGRCQPGQWSWLDHAIGAPVRLPGHGPAGASMACAIVSAEAARWLFRHPGADLAALCRHFRGKATYRR